MNIHPRNLVSPHQSPGASGPPTVVLLGESGALEAIGAHLSERGFQPIFVPNACYLAGAAALYEVIGVIGARPAADDLGGIVQAAVEAGLAPRLIAFVDSARVRLLIGSSFGEINGSGGPRVISAALCSIRGGIPPGLRSEPSSQSSEAKRTLGA